MPFCKHFIPAGGEKGAGIRKTGVLFIKVDIINKKFLNTFQVPDAGDTKESGKCCVLRADLLPGDREA